MRYTTNINLPIVEDNDLYSKEINNLAFERIDEEIKGLADMVETLESPENSLTDIKDNIKEINEQLETITNKAKIALTPEMFGAKGDDIADDYLSLRNMFNYRDNVDIVFPKDKIYRVSRGIGIEKQGLTVYGNNSTIKFTDDCQILQEIYNGVSNTNKATMLHFDNNDNMTFYNLHLDGNADNVTFIHNGKIYYGYQQDLGVEGIPKKYICTYGFHGNGCNNVILENCSAKHIGAPVNLGGVWGSNDIKKNIVIKNMVVEDVFRDAIVVCDCEDFVIENPTVINGQRKGIQCYRNAHKGKIINPTIINDEKQIRRWYPTWSHTNRDAELTGIAIQNPGYSDICTNIEIINPNIDVYKTGIAIRNYSENISITRGHIKSRNGIAINHLGVIDLILRDLTLIGSTCIANDYVETHSSVSKSSSTSIIENVSLEGDVGLYYKVHDTCSLESINVLANNLTLKATSKVIVAPTTKSNIIAISTNSLSNQILNGANIINPYDFLNIKNTYTTKLSYKSNSNKEYIKFFSFRTDKKNRCMLLSGTINKLSGNNVSCFDFKTMIRSHWDSLSNCIVTEVKLLNILSAQNTGIGYSSLYDEVTNSITVDFYFISSLNGNFMIDFQIHDYENSFDCEFISKSSEWLTDLTMTKEVLNT